ncbi:MAG: pyrimidine/purine nucleoside phosphorylase [Negativicutes bacterium]|nr:pyrimidine/purine nucleoside phosphorylase [Negativicutes bacterium]
MFKTNEYFGGQVFSVAFENHDGPATVGVMEAGEYEFGTSSTEYMTVVSGSISAQLPGEAEFKEYLPNQTFIVPPNQKFKVKITEQTAYLCLYK